MIWLRALLALSVFSWRHRGGRRCGPNCKREDHT